MIDLISDILVQLFPLVAFGVCWWPCCTTDGVAVTCTGCNSGTAASQWVITVTTADGPTNTCPAPRCANRNGTFYCDFVNSNSSRCWWRSPSTVSYNYVGVAPACITSDAYWHVRVNNVGTATIVITLEGPTSAEPATYHGQKYSAGVKLDCLTGSYTMNAAGDYLTYGCDERVSTVGGHTAACV
jgi:hypothetical protein